MTNRNGQNTSLVALHTSLRNRKRFWILLIYALVLSPWMVAGALRALESDANSPLDWVDDRFPPRQTYDRFCHRFGAADVLVISWPGCRVDDPRIDDLLRCLREARGFQGPDGWLFHRVTSGRESLRLLRSPPLSMSLEEATGRLQGWLIGPDRNTTSVVISFTADGLLQRARLIPLIQSAVRQYCGASRQTQHLAGPVVDGYSVDQASQLTTRRFAPLASIIAFCLCLLCIDSLIAAALVFVLSAACQALALAVLHYSGGSMSALLIVMPPLIQLLAIAGGIHFVNYYFDAATLNAPADAAIHALRIAWLPCLLSAVTTAIGLGSLMVSGLVAVRDFGFYASIGIVATVTVLLSFLPGSISHLKPAIPLRRRPAVQSVGWTGLTNWLERHSRWVTVTSSLLMLGLGLGVWRLEASVRIETLFGRGSRLLDDYAWIEEHVGSMVPIEVVARFPADGRLAESEKLATLQEIERVLRQVPDFDTVVSPLCFAPASASEGLAAFGRPIDSIRRIARESNYLCTSDEGDEYWRTTAFTSALGGKNFAVLLGQVEDALRGVANRRSDNLEIPLETSGLMPLVHEIQQQLLRDLFASFVTAFALILAMMTIVQAGVFTGLLSMIPNVFPALTLFGILGWCGQAIDIGSIMTASVAMGIAVDDTLHFLTFFQRECSAGKSRSDAVLGSYAHCGRAMIHTTIICGGGFAIFAFSDFAPTSRFAGMMILLLGAALVGDLLVLPALLLGPLGRQFETAFRSLESAGERSLMHGDAADRSLPPDVNNRPARTPANQVISGLKLPRPRTANPAVPDADRPLTR